MVGILLLTHGTLGESLIQCAAHVMGSLPPQLRHLSVTVDDDPEAILTQAREWVRQLDSGAGVLAMTDIFGATPSNITCKLLVLGRVEGVAGVNLPMLVRALTYRSEPLPTVLVKALSGGAEGVLHMPATKYENVAADG
jgi:PTS system mannose-specific IIA component